jgi:putative two-component system response regulator
MSSDPGIGSASTSLEGLARLADTLQELAGLPGLDVVQRNVVQRRVAALLGQRDQLMPQFRATCDATAQAAYRALRRNGDALSAQQVHDELLHLFALVQLTLVEGAETAGHLERTAGYARALAEARGDTPQFVAALEQAALIHDVGLMVVPQEVFSHRGLVDSYESLLLDTHTRLGAELVDAVMHALGVDDGPLALGREIVRCHHERYDGLGPQGLAGTAIPYAARLFAIADVYDTLRRRRPHREPLGHAAAVVAVRAGNRDGRVQFDPELLPAFVACAERFDTTFRAISESD